MRSANFLSSHATRSLKLLPLVNRPEHRPVRSLPLLPLSCSIIYGACVPARQARSTDVNRVAKEEQKVGS
jgi:hypothetical protein